MPSIDEIIVFARASNFGYNECDPYVRVMRLDCYEHSDKLARSLSAGIDAKEKARRLQSRLIE